MDFVYWFVTGVFLYTILFMLALAFVRGASIVSNDDEDECCNQDCNQGRDCHCRK